MKLGRRNSREGRKFGHVYLWSIGLFIALIGGIAFQEFKLGAIEMPWSNDSSEVSRVSTPVVAQAPEVVEDLQAKEEAEAAKKAAEDKAAKEEAEKKAEEEAQAEKEAADKEAAEDSAKEGAATEQAVVDQDASATVNSPPQPPPPADTTMYLTVPKMGRYEDPVTNTRSPSAIHYGAIKLPATGFPWQDNANTYISAHVLGYQGTGSWLQFADLPYMTYGDMIYLTDANGTTYTYKVSEILTVSPGENWVTAPQADRDMVSLQTCVGPNYEYRLIVRGDRVDVSY